MARRIALDTNILSHALGVRRVDVTSEWRQRAQACQQFISKNRDLCIPAPALTEALRTAPAEEQAELLKLAESVRTLALTVHGSVLAGRLLARLDGAKDACPRCHEPMSSSACSKCGRMRAPSSKVVDAQIAGCVLSQAGEWIIYSYDVRHFAPLLAGQTRVTVSEPPSYVSSAPLLDFIENQPSTEESDEGTP